MIEVQVLFWLAVGAVFYAFCGYPLLLAIFSGPSREREEHDPAWSPPRVTLLISVYNEEAVIEAKLNNGFELDYPPEKLEIIVVSDASSDRTDAVVEAVIAGRKAGISGAITEMQALAAPTEQACGQADPKAGAAPFNQLRLLRLDRRQGKSTALNAAVAAAGGEIIVFSDANAFYDRQAIQELVRPFQNPEVGLVSGCTRYLTRINGSQRESTDLYSKLELWLKRHESRIHSCVGADGAIFACRKHLFENLRRSDLNDLVIPFQVVEQGYRAVLNEKAFCLEEAGRPAGGEFERQVRIACRTLHALSHYKAVWSPWRQPLFAALVISHKLFKLMLPFFMLVAFAANLSLAVASSIYGLLLLLQSGGYLLALWGGISGRGKIASLAYGFCLASFAFLVGWGKWLRGETFTTWTPKRV